MTIPTSRAGIPLSTNRYAPLAGEIAGRDARHDSKVRAGKDTPPHAPGAAQKLQTLPDPDGDLGPYSGEGAGIADGEHLRTVVGLTRASDGTCSGSAFPFCVMAVDDRTVREDWSLPVAIRTPSGTYRDASDALETAAQHLADASYCTGPGWGVNGSTGVQSKWLSEGLGISLICVLNASSAQVRQIAGTLDDALRELPPPSTAHHGDDNQGAVIGGSVAAAVVGVTLLACCCCRPVRDKVGQCVSWFGNRMQGGARVAALPAGQPGPQPAPAAWAGGPHDVELQQPQPVGGQNQRAAQIPAAGPDQAAGQGQGAPDEDDNPLLQV